LRDGRPAAPQDALLHQPPCASRLASPVAPAAGRGDPAFVDVSEPNNRC
jgi:hypothetical protein